jgi:hypothetical protein
MALGATRASERRFGFPVDEVVMLTVFADVQTARATYEAYQKKNAQPSEKPRWRFWK